VTFLLIIPLTMPVKWTADILPGSVQLVLPYICRIDGFCN
jgi:hypothetical protein